VEPGASPKPTTTAIWDEVAAHLAVFHKSVLTFPQRYGRLCAAVQKSLFHPGRERGEKAELRASAPRSVAPFGGSARQGAGGNIAAQCPCQNQVPGDVRLKSGQGRDGGLNGEIFAYSRLFSLMFA
jgi:hypothetical protein